MIYPITPVPKPRQTQSDKWWHAHLYDSWIWFVNEYRERYDYISRAKNQYIKLNKQHYQEEALRLEAELERMEGE